MCNQYKIPIYSLVTGIVLTLITGMFPNVFLLSYGTWGYFLPWAKRALQFMAPFEIIWINFIVDVIIWSVLIYLAILSIEEEKVKKKPVKKKRKR